MYDISMNDLQKCQLDILKAFIEVCEKNHLQYYLIGGSALGAIRHQGFIPWDDDIDVAMPREDYDKFVNLNHAFSDFRYFIQTYKTDRNYIYNYAKVRDSKTTFVENVFAHQHINHGVWVDVYPLDGMSYQVQSPASLAKKVKKTWHGVYFMYCGAFWRKPSWRTLYLDLPLNFLALLFFWENIGHWHNKLIDHYAKKIPYKDAVLVGNLFGINAKREAMPKEIFLEGSHALFEGIDVIVPKDCHQYLTLLYGDYMKLPPLDKQVGHHYNKGLSLNEDYKSYCKKHRL